MSWIRITVGLSPLSPGRSTTEAASAGDGPDSGDKAKAAAWAGSGSAGGGGSGGSRQHHQVSLGQAIRYLHRLGAAEAGADGLRLTLAVGHHLHHLLAALPPHSPAGHHQDVLPLSGD